MSDKQYSENQTRFTKFIATVAAVIVVFIIWGVIVFLNEKKDEQPVAVKKNESIVTEHVHRVEPKKDINVAGNIEKIKIISNGEEVDIKEYVGNGYVVIIDFYADWCGPCLALAPKIEELVKENDDVILRKVNIVKWGSPVARQYGINSIPDVRVFDKKGNMIESPSATYSRIEGYVKAAKR